MKAIQFFPVLFFISTSIFSAYAQDCKVLKSEISLHYEGECKNGLAHGEGEATGVDYYIGNFKKGLPNGEGTYKWATGEIYIGEWGKGLRHGNGKYTSIINGKDSTIVGKWTKNKYIGTGVKEREYRIIYKNNISRVNINPLGEGNTLRIRILRGGVEVAVQGLLISGDSGTTRNASSFLGFENMDYPFAGRISFMAMNLMNSVMLTYELRFEIYKRGNYDIIIYI